VTDGDPGTPDVESRVAGETQTMVGMMDRVEKTRKHLTSLAIVIVILVFGLIGVHMFTTPQFNDAEYMLPLVAFGAGYLLGSIPFLQQAETRKHRSWAKKQT
jgi:hypothetical protein